MFEQLTSHDSQRLLIRFLLTDTDAFVRAQSILKPIYFDDKLRKVVRYALDYSAKYKTLPNFEQVEAETKEKLSPYPNPDEQQDWFFNSLEEFCRSRAMEIAILDGVDMLKEGRGADVETAVKEALTIRLVSDLGSEFLADPISVLGRITDRSNFVSTGWEALDEKLYGGFTRGSLNIFAGGSGSGKSLFLQNIALNWATAGMHVVYVTLELSEDLVNQRLYSMVTGMGTREVEGNVSVVLPKLESARAAMTGSLTVKKFPESATTANDLRAFVKEYEIKKGVRPDALVVDYLDLMHPTNARIDVSSLFTKDKFVSEELRALASELGAPLVTASQLNRSAVSTDEHDHSHIAGGISKVNTADNLISIVTSKKKREAGLQELQFLKTRTSNSVGSKIELGYDWKSMRITNDVPQATPQLPNSLAHNDDVGGREPRPERSERLAELVARARQART